MKKISCPECGREWDKDSYIKFHIQKGMKFTICNVKIQDLLFCPVCFFTAKGDKFRYPESYEAKGVRVLLKESNLEIKSVVVKDEFGRYIDMDFKELTLSQSGFNPNPNHGDDGGATMATESWGGAGPDCMAGPE